jgi:hypothetical protein
MFEDADRVKKLFAFKKKLEEKLSGLKSELDEVQATLETVNALLLEKGFKHAEIKTEAPSPRVEEAKAEQSPQANVAGEEVIPLKTSTGEVLAILHANKNTLRVIPPQDKRFEVNTPPFMHFLVERVLAKMQERDSELVRAGQLEPDLVFSYNIVREGDAINEIVIRNFDDDRLRELKSSIRWTFEKMYEKMKSQA